MDKLECSKATATRCIEELRNYLNAPLDYNRKRGGYFYNQQNAEKSYELPGGSAPKNLTACSFVIKSCKTSARSTQPADNPATTKNR
jgi:hypothetical protein